MESSNTVKRIGRGEVHHFVTHTHTILWRALRDECWQHFVSEHILLLLLKEQVRTGPCHIFSRTELTWDGLMQRENVCAVLTSPHVKLDVVSSRLKRTGMVWWCVPVSGMGNVHTCGGPIDAEGGEQVLGRHILPPTAVTTAWPHSKQSPVDYMLCIMKTRLQLCRHQTVEYVMSCIGKIFTFETLSVIVLSSWMFGLIERMVDIPQPPPLLVASITLRMSISVLTWNVFSLCCIQMKTGWRGCRSLRSVLHCTQSQLWSHSAGRFTPSDLHMNNSPWNQSWVPLRSWGSVQNFF